MEEYYDNYDQQDVKEQLLPDNPDSQSPDSHVPNPDSHAANPDSHVPDPDSHAANPDSHAANPDSHVPDPDSHAPNPANPTDNQSQEGQAAENSKPVEHKPGETVCNIYARVDS